MASALPWLRGSRTTSARARAAIAAVPSVDPSSTTTTTPTTRIVRTPRILAAIRADSSLAGMTTATDSGGVVIVTRPLSAG